MEQGSVLLRYLSQRETLPLPEPERRSERRRIPSLLEKATTPQDQIAFQRLDEMSRRIYGTSFMSLQRPFSRLVVSVAAFHPGAQQLLEKYGPDIFKSKKFIEAFLGLGVMTGVTVKPRGKPPIHVSFVDLQRAKAGGAAFSDKALKYVREAGITREVRPARPGVQFLTSILGTQPSIVLHPYEIQVGEKKTIALLPEPLPTTTKVAQVAGGLIGAFIPAGITGGILSGIPAAARLGAIGQAALMGATVGAGRAIARLEPPAEAAKTIGEEAVFWGAFPIVGKVLGGTLRQVPGLARAGRAFMEAHPRLGTALAEAATQALTEATVGTGLTYLETGKVPTPKEIAQRAGLQALVGAGLGAITPRLTSKQLAETMQKTINAARTQLSAKGYADAEIETVLKTMGMNLRHQIETTHPDLLPAALQQLPPEMRTYFEPAPRVEPAPTVQLTPPPPETVAKPTPPATIDEAIEQHLSRTAPKIAEKAFDAGKTAIDTKTVKSERNQVERLLGRKLEADERKVVEERLREGYQQNLDAIWAARSIREHPKYEEIIDKLVKTAQKEGWDVAKLRTKIKQKLISPSMQSRYFSKSGWRKLLRQGWDLVEEDVRARLTSTKIPETPPTPTPEVAPAPTEVTPAPAEVAPAPAEVPPPAEITGTTVIHPEDVSRWQAERRPLRVYHVTIDVEGWERTGRWSPETSGLGQLERKLIWAVTNRESAEYLARTLEEIRQMAMTLPPDVPSSPLELQRWISKNRPELYKKLVEVQYYGDPRQIKGVGIVELDVPMEPTYRVSPLSQMIKGEGNIGFAQMDETAKRMRDYGWRAENFGAYAVAIDPNVPVAVRNIKRVSEIAPPSPTWEHKFREGEIALLRVAPGKVMTVSILQIDDKTATVRGLFPYDIREVNVSDLLPVRMRPESMILNRPAGEIAAEVRRAKEGQKPSNVGEAVEWLREQFPEVINLPLDVQIAMGRTIYENWDALAGWRFVRQALPSYAHPALPTFAGRPILPAGERPALPPHQPIVTPPPGDRTIGEIRLDTEAGLERLNAIKRTDQPAVKSALRTFEGIDGEVTAVAENGAWVRIGDLMLQIEPDLLPSPETGHPRKMQAGDFVFFDAPYDAERIRSGELVWDLVPVRDAEGVQYWQWVLTEAENLPAKAMHALEEAVHPETMQTRKRQRGAVLGPSEWFSALSRLMKNTDVVFDDTVPVGIGYKERNVTARSLAIARILTHYGVPSEKAAGLKHPAGLALFRRVSDAQREVRELEKRWTQMADEALRGTTEDERLRMFAALQDDNVYQAMRRNEPDLARRVDIIKQIITEVGDEGAKEGLIKKRADFDISHILWGDWMARVYFTDAQGNEQVAIVGAYGTAQGAKTDAIQFARTLQAQGATNIRIEIDAMGKLPPAASRFNALAVQRLMGEAEAQARHLKVGLETYQRVMQRVLQNPAVLDPNSPMYDPAFAAQVQQLEMWLDGTIDTLPADVMNALRKQLQLQPVPWWQGQRRLNLETYDRRLEVVLPAYLQSVLGTLFNRKVRKIYREILAEHTTLTPEDAAAAEIPALIRNTTIDPETLVFMDEYVDTLTGGRNALGKLENQFKALAFPIRRANALLASMAAIKYLGLNVSKWLINMTQPFQFTAPLVGFDRTLRAWMEVPKIFTMQRLKTGKVFEVQGQKYTLDELARITNIDVQDFRQLFGLASYLGDLWDRASHILMFPFTSAEVPNRLTAALAGIDYGLTMLRRWLADPEIRQRILQGQPPVRLREGIGRYLEGSEEQFWRAFRDVLPKWAAEVEARGLDAVLHDAALEVGRWVVDKTQFRQDITDMPMFISRGGTSGRMLFQFGNFLVHELEFLFGPNTTIAQKAKAFAVMAGLAGLAGLPLFDEVDYIIRKLTGDRLSPKRALLLRAADEQNPEHWMALGAYKGLPALLGVDMSQSLGLPFWQIYERMGFQPDIERGGWEILLRRAPAGAWVADIILSAMEYAKAPTTTNWRRLLYALLPVSLARMGQAYFAAREGVLRSSVMGRALTKDIDNYLIATLMLGFTPTRTQLINEIRKELLQIGKRGREERSHLADQIADLHLKALQRPFTEEEREQYNRLLAEFYELGGDWSLVERRIREQIDPQVESLWKGRVAEKDLRNSPTTRRMIEILRKHFEGGK